MDEKYERLFNYWCLPHQCLDFPEHLQTDPIKAYGAYAFEEGFKLALSLTVPLLSQDDFNPYNNQ